MCSRRAQFQRDSALASTRLICWACADARCLVATPGWSASACAVDRGRFRVQSKPYCSCVSRSARRLRAGCHDAMHVLLLRTQSPGPYLATSRHHLGGSKFLPTNFLHQQLPVVVQLGCPRLLAHQPVRRLCDVRRLQRYMLSVQHHRSPCAHWRRSMAPHESHVVTGRHCRARVPDWNRRATLHPCEFFKCRVTACGPMCVV
jgi:hypothetical protein